MIFVLLTRELHAALVNRLVHFFGGLMLLLGFMPLILTNHPESLSGHILVMASLYLVPLVALSAGTGSAQNEMEEQPLLMSQPIWRGARLLGKWLALDLVLTCGTLLMILPALMTSPQASTVVLLGFQTAVLAATFAALGLAIGFSCSDRVKAHMIALGAWLFFLLANDFAALTAASLSGVRALPELWLALLMLNPLDAFRIGALLTLDRIPFDPLNAPALAIWWTHHLTLWFFIIAGVWTLLFLLWGAWKLERAEP